MIRRIAIIATLLGTLSAAPSRAGIDRAGTTAANFLQVGTGASALGMGGATLGLAGGDLGSMTWNAASLAHLRETQIAFSHVGLAQSSAQEWAAVAGRMQNLPFGWAFSGLYQGDGSFEGRDALGNSTGSFSASSMAFGANGAYTFMEKVNVGLGLKYVSEALGDVRGSGMALDLGVHVQQGRYGFGAAMQNTAGKMNYDGAKYPFGAVMGLGVSMTDPGTGLRAAVDFNVPNAYYPDVRAGVEWLYHDRFALRTGYRYEMGAETGEPLGGPTFGMGAGANGFWFDYAMITGGASGDGQHRVALTYRPGALNLGGMGGGGFGASTPATSAPRKAPEVKSAPRETQVAAKDDKPKKPKKPKGSVAKPPVFQAPAILAPATASNAAPSSTPAPVQAQAQPAKPQTPSADPVALDTAPPRPVEKPMSSTPGGTAAAAKRAQAANVPSTTVPTTTKTSETPKTLPFIVPPPAAPKPAPVVAKPVETVKAPETKPAETPKPVETEKPVEAPKVAVVAPAETPKPAETPAAPVIETPKPVEKQPAPVKAEPAKPAAPRPTFVTVKKGETLDDLAKEWGTSAAAIMMENNLITSKPPKPGTRLKLPPKSR